MTAVTPQSRPVGIPRASPWVRKVMAEMVRGRHVIVHGNVHDVAVWEHRFVPVAQVLRGVLRALGFELIGSFDQLDGLSVDSDGRADGDRRFSDLLSPPAHHAPGAAASGQALGGSVPAADVRTGDAGNRSGRVGAARGARAPAPVMLGP